MSDDNYKKELLHTLIRPSENELIVSYLAEQTKENIILILFERN